MKTPAPSPSCLAQLNLLSGEQPPHCFQYGDFPARIGRGKDCQVQLTGKGIWEQHLELRLEEDQCFSIRPASEATAMVNGEPLEGVQPLRNGPFGFRGEAVMILLLCRSCYHAALKKIIQEF